MYIYSLLTLYMMLLLQLTHSWEWTKLTPTANQPEDFPTNITAGVLEDQFLLNKVFLLMGHREIWSVSTGPTVTFSNEVYTYNIENNRWSKLSVSSKPTGRAYPAGVSLFNRIYFYGGSTFLVMIIRILTYLMTFGITIRSLIPLLK